MALISTALLAGCSLGGNAIYHSPSLGMTVNSQTVAVAGTWQAELGRVEGHPNLAHTWFSIQLAEAGSGRRIHLSQPLSRWTNLLARTRPAGAIAFPIDADAGPIQFHGQGDGRRAAGDFEFTPREEFVREISPHLEAPPTALELLQVAVLDVRAADAAAFAKAGVRLTAGQLCRLTSGGVSPEYAAQVRQSGANFSVDDIVRLRSHGVPGDMPAALKQAGYDFGASDLTRLRSHGVSAAEAAAWKQAGFDWSAAELTKLHSYGVKPGFGRAAGDAWSNLKIEELTMLRSHGVSEKYLADLKQTGQPFQPEEVVRLRSHGVQPEYVAAWHKAGFNFTAQELIRLHSYRVPVSYAEALNVPGRKPLPVETIIDLRNRGLSADAVRKLRE